MRQCAVSLLIAMLVAAAAAVVQAKSDEDYVVRLGYYNCDHMTGAPVAKDAGIFDELGLKVEVTGNGKVPQAMAAGQMDVGYIGYRGLLQANEKGSPILVSANNHLGGSMYLVVRDEIKTPKDLLGKKLAIDASPEKTNENWIRFAGKAGIPVEGKNYQTFAMSDKDEYLALKTGNLDGYSCCDPWGSMAEYEKTGRIMAKFTTLPSGKWGVCCVYAMNKSFAKDHPELAKKMILAHTRAIQFIYTHPLKTAEIFSKNYYVPLEVALMTIFKKTVEEDRTLTWKVDKTNFQDEVENLLSIKLIDKQPKLEEVIFRDFLDQCGADDFDTFIKEKVNPLFPLGMTYPDWKKKAYQIEGKSL